MTSPHVIPAKSGIHKIFLYFFTLTLFVLSGIVTPFVLASAKTDYEYQYGQYRLHYPEYKLLKADYLATPSLDNQQKTLLAAKQTIYSRDLAKASFAWYLMDLVAGTQANYEPLRPIVSSLAASREFYLQESQQSQSVVTQEDLKKFTEAYLKAVPHHDRMIKFGILGHKLATLVRLQTDSKNALDSLVPRLPGTLPATLTARIQELRDSAKIIDAKIDLLAKNLNLAEDEVAADAEIFFTSRVEKLAEIRTLQLDWINRLIDIEKNYAQSN